MKACLQKESNKLRIQVKEGKIYEIKVKGAKSVISNLKIKVEESKRIEDCLNIKLKDKTVECLKIEEENTTLRNALKREKEQIEKREKFGLDNSK